MMMAYLLYYCVRGGLRYEAALHFTILLRAGRERAEAAQHSADVLDAAHRRDGWLMAWPCVRAALTDFDRLAMSASHLNAHFSNLTPARGS